MAQSSSSFNKDAQQALRALKQQLKVNQSTTPTTSNAKNSITGDLNTSEPPLDCLKLNILREYDNEQTIHA